MFGFGCLGGVLFDVPWLACCARSVARSLRSGWVGWFVFFFFFLLSRVRLVLPCLLHVLCGWGGILGEDRQARTLALLVLFVWKGIIIIFAMCRWLNTVALWTPLPARICVGYYTARSFLLVSRLRLLRVTCAHWTHEWVDYSDEKQQ